MGLSPILNQLPESMRKIMRSLRMLACAIVAVIGFSSMGFAQDSKTNTPRVDRREQNQQKRVADGVKDGSLSSGEAAKIEGDEAKIQQDEAKAKADGVVTPDERKKLNRELDKTSREISRDRDNTPGVDRREQNQQNRVANGLKDGSLTSGEAAKIERGEAKIQRDEAKAKADGVVTSDERKQLNRELNQTSREISRDRDNTPGIDRREQNQQDRVANGLKDGSLSSGEAAKIESDETKIRQDEAKAKADGVVTPDERKKLNRELNKTSREISRDRDNTPGVDRREQNQQKRVANGLKDGSLTSGEAAKIERGEAKIQRDEAKAKADGVVTSSERKQLNRELNRTGREIKRDRDNTPGIDRREQNQQNRVANGLKNGSLTSGEAAKIERDEAKIQRDEARAKADGVVTARERARLNRELNHTSREIHRDKHNNRRQR